MSSPTLRLGLEQLAEPGGVQVDLLLSAPTLAGSWPEGGGPRLLIEEPPTTLCLRFLRQEDLLAFQHNLAHLAIPSGHRR